MSCCSYIYKTHRPVRNDNFDRVLIYEFNNNPPPIRSNKKYDI